MNQFLFFRAQNFMYGFYPLRNFSPRMYNAGKKEPRWFFGVNAFVM